MEKLYKLDRWVEAAQTWICILLFSAILLFGSIQIFGRYAASISTPWTEELMRFCMIWLTMIGSALTIRVDGHVSVDIVLSFMKNNRRRAILFIVARVICVLFLLLYFPSSVQLILNSTNSQAASLPIPYGIVYAAVPVGIMMMLLSYASSIPRQAAQYRKGEK